MTGARRRPVACLAVRFIIFVIDTVSGSGTADEMTLIDAFNDRLRAEGHWVMAAGIAGPDSARVVDGRRGTSTEGSVFPGSDFYSGFWIVDAPDSTTAELLARDGSAACGRRVELRPFLG